MRNLTVISALIIFSRVLNAQNDLDAIRYSRASVGGTSRFISMGGAMGALGADLSCSAYNPAGIGLFRKGEISYSAGLRMFNNEARIYNTRMPVSDAKFVFNNFGIAFSWQPDKEPENRHVIVFANTQLQNYFNATRITGYTNNSSLAKDMLNLAEEKRTATSVTGNLNYNYEGLGFNTYLLDTADNAFFSFVDTKRSVKQTRDVVTSGKINDLNFSYAYSIRDDYYIGVSLGIPQVSYESFTSHTDSDDRDSMRIGMTGPDTYTTTYTDEPPVVYTDKLGFKSLTYEEYFKTSGSGLNLKIGAIARLNDLMRVGLYFHTPTLYRLTDEYYNSMSVAFDADPANPVYLKEPADGGYFKYRITSPGRIGANVAFVIGKSGSVGIDYELMNYGKTRLGSERLSDFAGVNAVISNKYGTAHNVRLGGELNLSPFMIRAGYAMNGSPFGDAFSGKFVRHTGSLGAGFRKNNFYTDVVFARSMSTEDYFLFTTLNTKGTIDFSSTMIGATIGFKF